MDLESMDVLSMVLSEVGLRAKDQYVSHKCRSLWKKGIRR